MMPIYADVDQARTIDNQRYGKTHSCCVSVDLADCPNALLDAIFSEAYSRWGGRRTLIVAATSDGIDKRYTEWLLYFDADVFYSFVSLSDACVAAMHERYAPAHLVKHREWSHDPAEERRFQIDLPLVGLSSLSVMPVFVSRSWGFDGPPRNVKILTKFWEQSQSPLLRENFGFLSSSFGNSAVELEHPELYSVFTLITPEALGNPRLGKDQRATYVTSEEEVLDAIGAPAGPMALSQLCDFFAPYLDTGHGGLPGGTCLVVGDTPSDRLIFWNLHHRFERQLFSSVTTLRIPAARVGGEALLRRVKAVIRQRGAYGHNGRRDHISLHSCSLAQEELETLAARLREAGMWLGVSVARHADHAAVIPRFRDDRLVQYRTGDAFSRLPAEASAEFESKRASVPIVAPWHIKEALPPAGLRGGSWMIDLTVDRLVDHCPYANVRHTWQLPRRLRIERAFTLEREGEWSPGLDRNLIRIVRPGVLGVAMDLSTTRASLW